MMMMMMMSVKKLGKLTHDKQWEHLHIMLNRAHRQPRLFVGTWNILGRWAKNNLFGDSCFH